jgi:hypothetical protein
MLCGSVLLPYLDLGILGNMTGIDMIQLFTEVVDESGDTTGGGIDEGGEGEGMGTLGMAIFLFAISPFINLVWGGLSFILALFKVGLRGAGLLHLIFSGALLFTTVASKTDALIMEVSMMDIWGVGIWVAMVGGLILLFDNNSDD